MAKKKTKIINYVPLLAALLGIVAVVMIFLPAVTANGTAGQLILGGEESVNGLKAAFGWSQGDKLKLEVISFSFMNMLTYILAIAGVVLSIMGYLARKGKFFQFLAAVCFAVAAVFFFCTVAFLGVEADAKEYLSLGVGAIIAGVSSALAALVTVVPVFLKK